MASPSWPLTPIPMLWIWSPAKTAARTPFPSILTTRVWTTETATTISGIALLSRPLTPFPGKRPRGKCCKAGRSVRSSRYRAAWLGTPRTQRPISSEPMDSMTRSAPYSDMELQRTRFRFHGGPNVYPVLQQPSHATVSGCTAGLPQSCITAAQAPYAGNAQMQQIALAALNNLGCYVQGSGILTPPAYGTVGNASRNMFRAHPYYHNIDFSVTKDWKFTERFSAQFRAEFFNFFNWTNLRTPRRALGGVDPSAKSQFGLACATPDVQGTILCLVLAGRDTSSSV